MSAVSDKAQTTSLDILSYFSGALNVFSSTIEVKTVTVKAPAF